MWYVARYIAVAPPSEPGRQQQVRLRHPTRRRCSRHRCLRRLLSLRLLPAPALPLARCCRRRRDCLPPLCLARATRLCFRAPLLPRTSVSACLRFCAPLLPPPRSLPPAPPPRPPAVTHPLSSFCGSLGMLAVSMWRPSFCDVSVGWQMGGWGGVLQRAADRQPLSARCRAHFSLPSSIHHLLYS